MKEWQLEKAESEVQYLIIEVLEKCGLPKTESAIQVIIGQIQRLSSKDHFPSADAVLALMMK